MNPASATEIAEAVRDGTLSAVEVVEAAFARIASDDPAVNSFVALDPEGALEAARAVDAQRASGEDPGPLAGVPFGVKDNEAVRGMPTRFGSLLHAGAGPESEDSEHVARLRAAGAIPVGKVAMGEFGLDAITHSLAHGTTRNPWNPDRTPGGSSGGSAAAVAAGLVPLCTGSDALGSIRCPAGFTGTLGLKPSHGLIPRAHGFRDTASLGALTMTVADTARYLDVVAGPSRRDRMTLPSLGLCYEAALDSVDVAGLTAAWSPDLGYAPVDPEIADICERAFVRLAGLTRLRTAPAPILSNVYVEWNALAALELKGDFEREGMIPDRLDQISPVPRQFIESIEDLTLAEQSLYRARIRAFEGEVATLFGEIDLLVTPTACCAAYDAEGPLPTVIAGRDASETNAEPYTAVGSICWMPSISLPCGTTRDGLPVGLLITGPRHCDDIVLRIARIWEQAAPWPRVAPRFSAGPA